MKGRLSIPVLFILSLVFTAESAATNCTAGNTVVEPVSPHTNRGQFLDLQHPSSCNGNITAWHFCYYPSGVSVSSVTDMFSLWFRVWRPERAGALRLVHDYQVSSTVDSLNTELQFVCDNIVLQVSDYLEVEEGDIIGVYVPIIFSNVPIIGQNAPAESVLHFDTRDNLVPFDSDTVRRRDLSEIPSLVLHLYADIKVQQQSMPNDGMSTNEGDTPTFAAPPPQSPNPTPTSPPPLSPAAMVVASPSPALDGDTTSNGGGGGNGGVVAAIVIVLLLVVAAIIAAVVGGTFFYRRWKANSRPRNLTLNGIFSIANALYNGSTDRLSIRVHSGSTPVQEDLEESTTVNHPYAVPRPTVPSAPPRNSTSKYSYSTVRKLPYDVPRATTSPVSTAGEKEYVYMDSDSDMLYSSNGNPLEEDLDYNLGVLGLHSPYDIPKPIASIYSSPGDGEEDYFHTNDSGACSSIVGGTTRKKIRGSDSSQGTEEVSNMSTSVGHPSTENYVKLEQATFETDAENESPYSVPSSRMEDIYIELSRYKIKIIPREAIETAECIGSGSFGSVEKGTWKPNGPKQPVEVALKTLSTDALEEDEIKFLQEAAIMAQFKHPNIVHLHGIVTQGSPLMLVVEFLPKGDLRRCLIALRPDNAGLVPTNTPQLLLSYSQQVALGMHYLASKGFVHRDLAARNIFVSRDNICKIGDFGMSRDLADEQYFVSHLSKIPLKWTAPEAIHCRKYSTASDVWSYGCLLYEIWSLGRKPFKGFSNAEAIEKLDSGYRLPPPPGCPRVIYEVMIQCWHRVPSTRPNFRSIFVTLLQGEPKVLEIPVDDASTHEHASVLGSSLQAGELMYTGLQEVYLTHANHRNSDYEYISGSVEL